MIICNVDHLHPGLRSLSQEASAQFLTGDAAFHEVLAALENAQLLTAASAARRALKSLDNAARSFSTLAGKIHSEEYRWIANATRTVDFADAARTVYLSQDSALIRGLNTELVSGNLHKLFAMFSEQITDMAKKLRHFADRASGTNVILDDEYRLAHELLRDWRAMISEGQYVSSVCIAAATLSTPG